MVDDQGNQNLNTNKEVVRGFYSEVLEKGNLDYAKEKISDDYIEHEKSAPSTDREGLMGLVNVYRNAFPDLKITVEQLIAEGDWVVSHYRIQGTHQGEFLGISPTGKVVDVLGVDLVRFKDGKPVEHWGYLDESGFMEQLGITPPTP